MSKDKMRDHQGILPAIARGARNYTRGVSTKGKCAECHHGATAVTGCRCTAEWCPCHAAWKGHRHGAHSCNCR